MTIRIPLVLGSDGLAQQLQTEDSIPSGEGAGTVLLNFGAAPGSSVASTSFVDAGILVASQAEAFVVASDTSSDHSAQDHQLVAMLLSLTVAVNAGVGGTVNAFVPNGSLIGTFKVRYAWR